MPRTRKAGTPARMGTAGYSGTPLAQKLGYKPGLKALVQDAPDEYADWLAPLPAGVEFQARLRPDTQLIHVFVHSRAALVQRLGALRSKMDTSAAIWVSWPKKSSKVPTDLTEDTLREVALPLGLVDVKVCAVNDVWSGLKLVVRKELR